jgi:hypothetical protein
MEQAIRKLEEGMGEGEEMVDRMTYLCIYLFNGGRRMGYEP